MAKTKKTATKRSLFRELMAGVGAMREHREGRLTLRTHHVEPIVLPVLEPDVVRETRESLHMSRQVFAFKLGVNARTLERWEQGRSKPNEQAAALIWLVRKYPDTLDLASNLWVFPLERSHGPWPEMTVIDRGQAGESSCSCTS